MATRVNRDSQRSKFYNWMYGELSGLGSTFGVPAQDVEKLISECVLSYGHAAPRFSYKKSVRNKVGYQAGSIILPKLQNMRPDDIARVVGWRVYDMRSHSLNEGWHGPTFCRVFAETYSKLTSIPVKDIISSMKTSKLKVVGAASGAPAGPRIVKRFDKASSRVVELENSIRNARKEFEAFLQPVLAELARAKLEKSTLESKIRG